MLVDFPENAVQSMRANLDQDVLLLGAASAEEASWISELYEGDIDVVVLSKRCQEDEAMERARERMRSRRPHMNFFESEYGDDGSGIELLRLTEKFKKLLQGKAAGAIQSAN